MRLSVLSIYVVLGATVATAATAEKGAYSGALRKMLTETAAGTCPADIMGEKLLNACREQLPKMGPALQAAGPIRTLTFVRTEKIKGDRFETYKVTFAKGEPSTWHIGGLHEGRFNSTYSSGD